MVKPEATFNEVETAMRSGDVNAVYREAILQPGSVRLICCCSGLFAER